ncbi:Hypothetical predicted protein, partial [Mytilus galloprovincialis]
ISSGSTTVKPNEWEYTHTFQPWAVEKRCLPPKLVTEDNNIVDFLPNFYHNSTPLDVNTILQDPFAVYDPTYFVAGNLHSHVNQWRSIIADPNCEQLKWLEKGVNIHDFMQPYKGEFWGMHYDDKFPPARQFKNARNCEDFVDFINSELIERINSGAVTYLGKVGEVHSPHIVSPITIEPLKPRLSANQAISNAILHSSNVLIDDEIKAEIMYWEFLDTWDKPFLLVSDRHFILEISTDSSGYKWGATISGKRYERRTNFKLLGSELFETSNNVKRSISSKKDSLISIQHLIKCKRIIAHVDNQAVVYAWENQH